MSSGKEYTVSEIIDSFGINGHTWRMFFLLAFAMIFDGYDFMIVNSTNTWLGGSFGVTGAALGSLTTWGLLGMVIGGAFGGIISDKIGRKKTLTLAVIFYGIFTLPQAFATSVPFFATFRIIAGLGVGSCIPIVLTTFSETVPSKNRGVFVTFAQAMMVAGWVIAGLVANGICNNPDAIIPGFTEQISLTNAATGEVTTAYANWRICYLIGAIPIIYGIILHFGLKETPHWYANSGRKAEAVKALAEIELKTTGHVTERDPELLVVPPKPAKASPTTLFSHKFIVATCAIWSLQFVGQFCVYGMNTWIPTWFQGVGYSRADSVTLQTLNNLAAIVSNITVGFMADKFGRKKNLIFGWCFCMVTIVLCSIFVVPNSIVLCAVLMLLFGFALNYTLTCVQPLMPESYPTSIRNTGTAWCQAFGRFAGSASSIVLGAIASMAIFQTAAGTTNWSQVVLVLLVPFALGLICTLFFVTETAGKSMDELSAKASTDANDTGTANFAVMLVVIIFLFALCIICPLAVPNWSKQAVALPLMVIGLILPFVYFFLFGGIQKARDRKAMAR